MNVPIFLNIIKYVFEAEKTLQRGVWAPCWQAWTETYAGLKAWYKTERLFAETLNRMQLCLSVNFLKVLFFSYFVLV